MPFVFGMVVLASLLIATPAAQTACRSPKNICKHFDDCLQRTPEPNNKDADGIRAGVKARNGRIVLAGAEACARHLGALGPAGSSVRAFGDASTACALIVDDYGFCREVAEMYMKRYPNSRYSCAPAN
jgi:hypothetical protein